MRLVVFLLLSVSLLYACKNEPKTDDRLSLLTGHWDLVQAFRNDTETQTLAGTFFEFEKEGQMRTNLPLQTEPSLPFTLDKDKIKQGGAVPVEYKIKALSATELNLIMELQGISFDMRLKKN